MLARLQHKVVAMGLGLFLFFVLCCVIGGGVWVIAAIEQAKARHRQEMEDFVRGRTARTTIGDGREQTQFGSPAAPFLTTPDANAHRGATSDTADLVAQLQAITRLAKGKTSAKDQAKEAAWVRSADRDYRKFAADMQSDNREYRARQPGRCTLQITYVDMDGVITTRKVAPYRSGNTNQKFDAWCETRQDRRTFFFGSVQGGTHLNTGQRLDRAGVFKAIHPGRKVPAELL